MVVHWRIVRLDLNASMRRAEVLRALEYRGESVSVGRRVGCENVECNRL